MHQYITAKFSKKYRLMSEYLVLLLFVLTVVYSFFSYTQFYNEKFESFGLVTKFLYVLRYVSVIIFILNFLILKLERRQLYICIGFIAIDFILKKFTGKHVLFEICFLPLCLAQCVNRKKFCNVLLATLIVCFFLILFGHFLGYFTNEVFYRGDLIRETYGFCHPNTLGLVVLVISFVYVLKRDCFNFADAIILLSLSIFCYLFPRSITSAACILMLIVFSFISNYFMKMQLSIKSKNIIFFVSISFILTVIFFSYLFSLTGIGKETLINMPGSIWARFELGKIALERYDISFFGTPVEFFHPDSEKGITEYFVVDCLYIFMPLNYGLIVSLLFLAFFIYIIYKSIIAGEYKLLFIMLILVLYSVSEITVFDRIMIPIFAFIFCSSKNSTGRRKAEREESNL